MTNCVCLLIAAAWAAGDPPAPGCPTCGPAVPQQVIMTPAPVYQNPQPKGGLLQRLFGRPQPAPPEYVQYLDAMPATGGVVQAGSPFNSNGSTHVVNRISTGMAPGQAPVVMESAMPVDLQDPNAPKVNLKVAAKNQDQVGHEEDYSWVTGQLFYVHLDGGRWVVRYGLPDQTDKYGGSVVLAPTVEMKNFREGDLVCVTGRVVDERPVSPSLGGALYRADSISIVERSDP